VVIAYSAAMEAFESFVAVALEADGFVVSSGVKFPVKILTGKATRDEFQTHGFEVDLVAARSDRLILATVKSFCGSRGVAAEHVLGESLNRSAAVKRYAILNNREVRSKIVRLAARRYGYRTNQVELRFYVGRFAGRGSGNHEARIRAWAKTQRVGSGTIKVVDLNEVVEKVVEVARNTQYIDNPVLVALKVLAEAGRVDLGTNSL
jgi:hypothetical protein